MCVHIYSWYLLRLWNECKDTNMVFLISFWVPFSSISSTFFKNLLLLPTKFLWFYEFRIIFIIFASLRWQFIKIMSKLSIVRIIFETIFKLSVSCNVKQLIICLIWVKYSIWLVECIQQKMHTMLRFILLALVILIQAAVKSDACEACRLL